MPVNKSAKLTNKLGVHLEDAVDVFELVKKELAVNTRSCNKLGVHLEDALSVFQLLTKELDTINSSASSSKAATNITDDMFDELNAQRADLKALELKLLADQAEFNINRKKWESEKAKSEADRVQLEAEKTQLRHAQIQLKAAQSQLEDAKLNLESAQAKLEEAREQLETARRHLEASKTETDITNTKLAAAKLSLDAAKMRFEDATKQMKDAKSKFEEAKTQLEAVATSSNATAESGPICARLDEENVKLRNQIGQLHLRIKLLETENSNMKNSKVRLEDELKKSRATNQLERVKNENKISPNVKNKIAGEEKPRRAKLGKAKVFFDMNLRGVSLGRIVFELYTDTMPFRADVFRKLCSGEYGVSSTGKHLCYKGTTIDYVHNGQYVYGGDINKNGSIDHEVESIYRDMRGADEDGVMNMINPQPSSLGDLCMSKSSEFLKGGSFGISLVENTTCHATLVVIGKVIQGLEVVRAIHDAFPNHPSGKLIADSEAAIIANSGELS